MVPSRAGLIGAALLSLPALTAPALYAQGAQDWEGLDVARPILVEGVRRESKHTVISLSGIRENKQVTKDVVDKAYKALWAHGRFDNVDIDVRKVDDKARVTIRVKEYLIVQSVALKGVTVMPEKVLKDQLRIAGGEPLNPFHLKQDREMIREQYLLKGYHFSEVKDDLQISPTGEAILAWTVVEGPMVSVDRIEFSGNVSVDESDLRKYLVSKEDSRLLGLVTGREPFVARNLREDVERIKLYYQMEGWLDIRSGENVFVRDLVFSEGKTSVILRFHIDEGVRYRIRNVRFQFEGGEAPVFPEGEMEAWLVSKAGAPFTEKNVTDDVKKLREKYGEKAYILAEVSPVNVYVKESWELDLVYSIRQNSKITLGRLIVEGNPKTKEEVLRREFTRTGFVPGEDFNKKSMERSIRRITDRGWVEPGGLQWRTQESDDPNTRDVVLDVKEGQTGNIRFAAGYSSSYGILGMLEFTQRNFDITDIPESLGDMVGGTGFAGGGQFLRIRLMPAARRKSYSIDFREPYFMGYDLGLNLGAYLTETLRESYDDSRRGIRVIVDKRIEPFAFQLGLNVYEVDIQNVEPLAPLAVKDIQGRNTVFSLTPALIYDTRDSFIFPTEGAKFELSHEYAGQVLSGDFDFNKLKVEAEGHLTLYETENHLKHVLSSAVTLGWAHGARQMDDVPLIERFYAGGRDSIRGFEFRRMGPHEGRDPVGGEFYAIGTLEYSWPIFVEFLRGAFFYDIANLAPKIDQLPHETWRQTVGVGIRFLIPQLGNIPVKLDFGFPIVKDEVDERQTVTFDIGALF